MTTLIRQNLNDVKKYNLKMSKVLGWSFTPSMLKDFPDLAQPVESDDFCLEVIRLQKSLFQDDTLHDGKLGRGTWTALIKKYDYVAEDEKYWVLSSRRVRVESDTEIINFDQSGGLDLHQVGHFSRRSQEPKILVLHWGGLNPKQLHMVFQDPSRKVSSHGGIGKNSFGGVHIYQYLDLNHKAWHAGWMNQYSIGIDICQQPYPSWENHYREQGYLVHKMKNPTNRGEKVVLSLDPNIARATQDCIKSICNLYNIPLKCPRGIDGKSEQGEIYHGVVDEKYLREGFSGVIGHHHITNNKWDIACWWDAIWREEWK